MDPRRNRSHSCWGDPDRDRYLENFVLKVALMIDNLKTNTALLGVVVAFFAAASYGGSQVVGRKVVTELAPRLVAALFALFFGALILGMIAAPKVAKIPKSPRKSIMFICLSGVFASGGIALLYSALGVAPGGVVSPVASLTPLFALLFTRLFLEKLERVTRQIVLGTLLVLAGIIIISIATNA